MDFEKVNNIFKITLFGEVSIIRVKEDNIILNILDVVIQKLMHVNLYIKKKAWISY